jgi:serine/threonine-protein kinase
VDEVAFGRYRLLALIGAGAMGKVYKAHDTVMGRDVAIKVLPNELGAEPGYRERFRREAHTAARLTEPHIIPIHDTGEIESQLYLVMPVVEGIDLEALLQRDGPMSPERVVQVIEQLAAALDAAHAAGLVHRDVKPSNALVTARDFVYLIDFGIAHNAAATKLTSTGMIMGTLAYMAPERFTAGIADARSDIYALACVLHECLTGHYPYPGESIEQQIAGHLTLDPPRPSEHRPDLPVGFDEVIARGMAKDPDQRYQSAHQLATAARGALTTTPSRTPPTAPASRADPTRAAAQPRVQQPSDKAIAAPRQRLPSQLPVPQRRPADRHPSPVSTPPRPQWRRDRRRVKWPLIAAVTVVLTTLTAASIVAYRLQSHPPTSQSPTAQPAASPGQAGQPASPSGQSVLPFSELGTPSGVAVDSAGNVYVADPGSSRVLELAAGSSSSTALPLTGLSKPSGVAVDAARTVYVTNVGSNQVLDLAAGASSTTELPITGLDNPRSLAVDSAYNLYIAAGNQVLKLPAGSANTVPLPLTGLSNPSGVAVDSVGNLYVGDHGNNRLLKLAPDATAPTVLPLSGLNNPEGVAVNNAGDLYVVDTGNNRLVKLAAGSTTPTVLPFSGLNNPANVAVDSNGNVYVTDAGNKRVVKLSAG